MKWYVTLAGLAGLVVAALMLAGCPSPQPTPQTAVLYVTNASSYTCTGIYISSDSTITWGNNRLASPIPPQTDGPLNGFSVFSGTYDMAATFSSGDVAYRYNVYFAPGEAKIWTFYDLAKLFVFDDLAENLAISQDQLQEE